MNFTYIGNILEILRVFSRDMRRDETFQSLVRSRGFSDARGTPGTMTLELLVDLSSYKTSNTSSVKVLYLQSTSPSTFS